MRSAPFPASRDDGAVYDDELDDWHTPALVRGNDAGPIVDTELVEPEPDRTTCSLCRDRVAPAARHTSLGTSSGYDRAASRIAMAGRSVRSQRMRPLTPDG